MFKYLTASVGEIPRCETCNLLGICLNARLNLIYPDPIANLDLAISVKKITVSSKYYDDIAVDKPEQNFAASSIDGANPPGLLYLLGSLFPNPSLDSCHR